ncbi:hypothetical protein [Ponticoccus sp. (in: a-proteobacteria)]|uniref:hypothetical protein n=1 Tax=Ponticoccus sp. (in: a-proteobacteria) TaxID=1925025 RepID=UPI003AB7DE35
MKVTDTLLQHGRALEWLTSTVLLAFAVILAFPGDTLAASPSFVAFLWAGADEASVVLLLTFIGAMRYAGLWINGNWRRSPMLRVVGACCGAGIFLGLTVLFALPYIRGVQDGLSTGVGVYLVLAIADMAAAYRSGADIGNYPTGH